jgi:CRISPR-associated protein Cas5h
LEGELLVFDVWAPFAYFRKSVTTTTSLTFAIMPRSCIEGLVGAVLGFASADYPDKLKEANIALQIINKINKMPLPLTYTHTDYWSEFGLYLKGKKSKHAKRKVFSAPARIELLVDPHYRIYFEHKKLQNSLMDKLSKHETVFTPYLGSSSMIANFSRGKLCKSKTFLPKEPVSVSSVIPFFKNLPKINADSEMRCAIEQNLPIHITKDRDVTGTYSAIYSLSTKSVKVEEIQVTEVFSDTNESNFVTFLPTMVTSG